MTKKYIFLPIVAGVMALSSCSDFLDIENTYQLNQETFFDSDDALLSATAPLYNYVWYDFNDKFYYAMGDGRANNITAQYSDYIYPYTNLTETSLSTGLEDAWGSLYSVVAQANNTINNIEKYSTSDVSETTKIQCIAEARFMRGLAYWYIASLWGAGVIYDDTSELVDNYVIPASPCIDVMEYALRDMEYAAYNLPVKPANTGRVTTYSAYGMLSRMYLSMAGLTTSGIYDGTNAATNFNRGTRNEYYLDLAKKAALKVIDESGLSLLPNYGDLFSVDDFDNNSECLFQLQWMSGPTATVGSCANSMTRFLAWSTMVGDTNAWGGATYCSWDLWLEFTGYADATLGTTVTDWTRRHHCVASYQEYYEEMNVKNGGYTYGITETRASQGANIKKYVIGTNADNGISYVNNSGVNTYMMRLAEVYLNYTEASMGNATSTSDVTYFNMVRERAGMSPKSSVTYEDLRHERRVEFAFEGLYWYDCVRRAYYQQQEVINYMNNQYRNASYDISDDTNENTSLENVVYEISENYTDAASASVATATASSLTLPMSAADQAKNPYLLPIDNDGNISTEPYEFGEREVSHSDLFN
ncbi:MAG: RagB/SusD family nutrient uptake outer membrane protein [Prevotella sp.]|nr:RagB/SusD family nutrient uptake outer membrane protein [Prevotella sp.]